jgi:hypothetical protein
MKKLKSVLNITAGYMLLFILTATFICTGVLTGCAAPLKDHENQLPEPTVQPEVLPSRDALTTPSPSPGADAAIPEAAVYSPDGTWAVWSNVQEDLEDEDGLLYSIYQVLLYHIKSEKLTVFDIVGRDFSFLWSPDSKRVAATYSGRIWTSFSILDTEALAEIPVSDIASYMEQFKEQGVTFDYTLNENRPDPQINPLDWSPDSSKLLIFYQWHDTQYTTQSGTFLYEVNSGQVSKLVQNPPSPEVDHVPAEIPKDFEW